MIFFKSFLKEALKGHLEAFPDHVLKFYHFMGTFFLRSLVKHI